MNNASFRRYREVAQKGFDFLLYSHVKRFELMNPGKFTFELKSGKPYVR